MSWAESADLCLGIDQWGLDTKSVSFFVLLFFLLIPLTLTTVRVNGILSLAFLKNNVRMSASSPLIFVSLRGVLAVAI